MVSRRVSSIIMGMHVYTEGKRHPPVKRLPCHDVSIEIKSNPSTFRKLLIYFENLQTFFSYVKLRVYFHPEYKY